jgi:hypothetical protein
MKRKNERSLDTIADDINQLERANIFDIGGLLIEAKAQCEHGQWMPWLETEFAWSADTAERYMKVARLGEKFRTVRNLKLAPTTLYRLADHENEDDLPAIIDELEKHATKKSLKPREAERVIRVGIGRRRFGDRPDATLVHLVELDENIGEAWYENAVAALKDRNPETDEDANGIVEKIEWDALVDKIDWSKSEAARERRRDEVKYETDDILDGSPPDLPPPTTPPEPQKIGADSDWAEQEPFNQAVKTLLELRAKPISRFVGTFSSADLNEVSAFLMAVAAANKRAAA